MSDHEDIYCGISLDGKNYPFANRSWCCPNVRSWLACAGWFFLVLTIIATVAAKFVVSVKLGDTTPVILFYFNQSQMAAVATVNQEQHHDFLPKLVARTLKALPLEDVDLEATTLGKAPQLHRPRAAFEDVRQRLIDAELDKKATDALSEAQANVKKLMHEAMTDPNVQKVVDEVAGAACALQKTVHHAEVDKKVAAVLEKTHVKAAVELIRNAAAKNMRRPRALLSEAENIAVGAAGGVVEAFGMMPVLTFSHCSQEGIPLPRNFGGWFGNADILAGFSACITSMQMVLTGMCEKYIYGATEAKPISNGDKICAASLAGACSSLLLSPLELTMIQQQKLKFNGMLDVAPLGAFRWILQNYGKWVFLHGIECAALREAIFAGGYLGLAPVLANLLPDAPGSDFQLSNILAGSCAAGVIVSVLTQPIDYLKMKIQSDLDRAKYVSPVDAAKQIFSKGGMQPFYRSGLARTIKTCGAFFVISALREALTQQKTLKLGLITPQSSSEVSEEKTALLNSSSDRKLVESVQTVLPETARKASSSDRKLVESVQTVLPEPATLEPKRPPPRIKVKRDYRPSAKQFLQAREQLTHLQMLESEFPEYFFHAAESTPLLLESTASRGA